MRCCRSRGCRHRAGCARMPCRPGPFRRRPTWAVPVVSTSSCLTAGDVVDSSVAIAAVPTRMPSTGMIGKPYACDHLPDRYSAARSGVPMPPPTQSVMLDSLRRSRVRGDQKVVEVLPRVVTTGAAALDVHDDVPVGYLGGDLDDGLDLLDGARLEHHVGDADVVELLDQRNGFLEIGDACADRPRRRSAHRTDGPSAPGAFRPPAASTGTGRGTAC